MDDCIAVCARNASVASTARAKKRKILSRVLIFIFTGISHLMQLPRPEFLASSPLPSYDKSPTAKPGSAALEGKDLKPGRSSGIPTRKPHRRRQNPCTGSASFRASGTRLRKLYRRRPQDLILVKKERLGRTRERNASHVASIWSTLLAHDPSDLSPVARRSMTSA